MIILNVFVCMSKVIWMLPIISDEYGGYVGLVITQAFGLAGMVQYGIILASEVENQMTAVERILEYTKCPQEAALQSSSSIDKWKI